MNEFTLGSLISSYIIYLYVWWTKSNKFINDCMHASCPGSWPHGSLVSP